MSTDTMYLILKNKDDVVTHVFEKPIQFVVRKALIKFEDKFYVFNMLDTDEFHPDDAGELIDAEKWGEIGGAVFFEVGEDEIGEING